ncbi:MAG: type II secretion system F family protein, partial [Planctomycetaceae bacterium]
RSALELGGVLPNSTVAEFRAAQAAGTLPQALRNTAATATNSLLHNRLDSSLAVTAVYVWIMLVMVFNVVAFMMYWIIPKFKDIFNDFGVELPRWTVQAISLSDGLVSNMLLVMPLINLPILAGLTAVIVGTVGWGNLNFPLLMRWFPRWDAPGLLRSLSYTVESGRPIPESLEVMAEHARRVDLRERFARMQQATERGEPVWSALAVEGFLRGPEAAALEAAARTGNLHWALRTLADSMQRTTGHRAQFWLEILKPAVVVAVGCLVAFFVIAFFLPLVKLIQDLT